jgi:hypothetical protein
VYHIFMLGSASILLSLAALAVVLGWVPITVWPGISLGLFASLAGILEIRRRPPRPAVKASAWIGTVVGLATALLGIAAYVGLLVMASRVG